MRLPSGGGRSGDFAGDFYRRRPPARDPNERAGCSSETDLGAHDRLAEKHFSKSTRMRSRKEDGRRPIPLDHRSPRFGRGEGGRSDPNARYTSKGTFMIILTFVIGYLAIIFEHTIKVNKTASALLMAVVT